ncbi:AAA domain (dynein-related subfamily) domain-containing protein [Sarocladium implicatum]|nr:AAA domain (dynein-related subfamily) domain-containing protein [Sarocladium implicatum]
MTAIDVSRQRWSLLQDAATIDLLPAEIVAIIRDEASTRVLDAVAEAALSPPLTEHIFVHFEAVFADICARWILTAVDESRKIRVASSLARVLPFAPYLSAFIAQAPTDSQHHHTTSHSQPLCLHLPDFNADPDSVTEIQLTQLLLTAWRLLHFDHQTCCRLISPASMQRLFKHPSKTCRYLAVRVFCQLLHASELKLEELLGEHVGSDEPVTGDFDGRTIDYTFLSLHEKTRAKRVLLARQNSQAQISDSLPRLALQSLTQYVVAYDHAVLPRPLGPSGDPPSLVMTSTTRQNLMSLAQTLQTNDPILLHGLPGVGKTSLIHEIAKDVGMYSNMVTLHLNEQTDAKMLVGLYSTDSKPGSFQWRPGVLTTAVKEGRWVLVEDLDRAPTEVLSTLLPLIERKELLIPSRGEKIRAAPSFRLFATVRTLKGMNGKENLPSLVGMRFWRSLHVEPITTTEVEQVIVESYPFLRKFVAGVLAVFQRLLAMNNGSGARNTGRPVTMRDLMKWCRRLQECLQAAGSRTGDDPISETTRDWMFLEALDCFAGSIPDATTAQNLGQAIAEEMHLSKDRADHYMTANIPPLEEDEARFSIGRTRLRKHKFANRLRKSKRPFASTTHAKRLLEQIAVAVKLEEPVLLVGETGIGKTTVVQQLAESLGHKLIAVNLSQQSEVGDLLGGFKPVNARNIAVPLKEEFEDLFAATGISSTKNQKYLDQIAKCFAKGQWARVSKLWKEAPKMFLKIVAELERKQDEQSQIRDSEDQPAKRRKTGSKLEMLLDLRSRWDAFDRNLDQFDIQIAGGSGHFAFSFVEGNLVKALRNGDWVLLDEINLASPDTLESIADLLTGPQERPSLLLSETGEIEKIIAHPNFRIFGAMNPATDVGKRDLPVGIRSRFTELYVRSPDTDLKDLLTIIKTYIGSNAKNDQAADDIARLYLNTKRMAEEKRLVDGANEVPHFSLRTLTRVLTYVNSIAPSYGLRRALYEGFSMGFLTLLSRESEAILVPLIHHHLFDRHGNSQSLLSQAPKHPNDGKEYVKFRNKDRDRQYWLFQGNEDPVQREDYIITPYVERNLLNLVRATSTRKFPILIQGPTSAGKTSMIEYLANFTGNKFVRINNHEHTDLQEYLGTYVSGADGKLKFQEGLLVQAMRQGHWIVLDELNLAPTDVLEALNRLLDDNRELLIPETQEIVRPHENFILFATQNPPGLYGGRKALSRAFRNRFLELHFDDIPEDELEYILQQRSVNTSPPDCRRIVTVYKDLSRLRQTSRLFEQKDSFATLRDLFRWALRGADTREEIAAQGFMLLAERVRNEDERLAVKDVIEKVFKVKIDIDDLYSIDAMPELKRLATQTNSQGVVWTHAMRRLYILVARALRNKEPVLLVGETGCGKTTVCQLLAEALSKQLHIVNAHQNTETGDLIGSQRPLRNRGAIIDALGQDLRMALAGIGAVPTEDLAELLEQYKSLEPSDLQRISHEVRSRIASLEARSKALFEWSDGALVEAMKDGQYFLLDEISLADDSVLERLNSVLEPSRTLLLAEKGIDDSLVIANPDFQFFATMNPGGDFGKKELSPALRNRFTEIWVPPLSGSEDMHQIVAAKLKKDAAHLTGIIIQFASWFGDKFRPNSTTPFSVREILVWVQFVNNFQAENPLVSLVHGASTVFIDSIGANPSALLAVEGKTVNQQRQLCVQKLSELAEQDLSGVYQIQPQLSMSPEFLKIGDFSITRLPSGAADPGFAFHAPTTRLNTMRVLRALQMKKPILLEGNPGVGKTTLVAALAQACGQPLTRINLSDQTDLMDLFGTDVPVEGAEAGNFAWRDAPFLQAMQKGEWVLLDEMNLASQSVLEGLNACLDHRGEVYISELDQVFKRHPDFRLFAAQNPHHQGGGRKGLPASFVNRFIVVYADTFTEEDLTLIASHNFPDLPTSVITNLIHFVSEMDHELIVKKSFGSQGGPWEFNLRDVLRWLKLLTSSDPVLRTGRIDDYLDIVIRQRFRTQRDLLQVDRLFESIMSQSPQSHSLYHNITERSGQVGLALLTRNCNTQPEPFPQIDVVPRLSELESVMICVKQNIPCILSGPSGVGKSALLEHVAAIAGQALVVFPINADVDTMDLIGGFEQADPLRELNAALKDLYQFLQTSILSLAPAEAPPEALNLCHLLQSAATDAESIVAIRESVKSLMSILPMESEVGMALKEAQALLDRPLFLSDPRFEWLDGVIVKALQKGQWLVLDNANMCNASVLDRLNSLLEPNGFLSINEHCGPGGEPRIVRPHPDFRIFLTTDPRYGELSRAMRNRSVEIFIEHAPPALDASMTLISGVDSRLLRYSTSTEVTDVLGPDTRSQDIALDHLNYSDLAVLPRFVTEAPSLSLHFTEDLKAMQAFAEYLQSSSCETFLSDVDHLYSQAADLPQGTARSLPVNPLNNTAIARLLQPDTQARWLNVCLEFGRELFDIRKDLHDLHSRAQTSKIASLTRLQRSLVSDRVVAVSKDSTVGLAKYFSAVISMMNKLLADSPGSAAEALHRVLALRLVTCHLQRTIEMTNAESFDEAEFQAHLVYGSKMMQGHLAAEFDPTSQHFATAMVQQLDQSFAQGFKLKTGLSMEQLWRTFRPLLVPSEESLSRVLQIVDLTLSALEQSFEIARSNDARVDELIADLQSAVSNFEAQTAEDSPVHEPYFVRQFDALRQLSVLQNTCNEVSPQGSDQSRGDAVDQTLVTLSNVPSKSSLIFTGMRGPAAHLQLVEFLTVTGTQVWDGKLTASIWNKLQDIGSVSLGSLALVEAELPILGRQLSNLSGDMAADPLLHMNALLHQLIVDTFESYDPALRDFIVSSTSSDDANGQDLAGSISQACQSIKADDMREVSQTHLIPALHTISAAKDEDSQRAHLSALAWLHFAVALVKLYVPDKMFDPEIRPRMERDFHKDLLQTLEKKMDAVRAFERHFTGQDTNTRIELMLEEVETIGPLPAEALPVYRPRVSELSKLQAEFSNILKITKGPTVASLLAQDASMDSNLDEIQLVKGNLQRLLDRLSARFEAYQDVTLPACNIMRCMLVGLSMFEAKTELKRKLDIPDYLAKVPFVGYPVGSVDAVATSSNSFGHLHMLRTAASIEGLDSLTPETRQSISECFHAFFEEWQKRLESDRKAEEAKTSLYRFRGSAEDEEEMDEEEFNELFPSYEEDAEKKPSARREEVRDTSQKVAEIHAQIFGRRPLDKPTAIQDLIRDTTERICQSTSQHGFIHPTWNRRLLAGVATMLQEQSTNLTSSTATDQYNFYTDANLSEARNLVSLCHKIKARFQELQQVDEIGHMQPLADIVMACDKIFELIHTEPLAKILTSVEQLHALFYEWQFGGWASKVHGAPALYDSLTETIVRWRRLELSTWAKLLDMEISKCKEDARSWYFIAYEVVIAVPLSMVESATDLSRYAVSLIQNLQLYFSTSILGQFQSRLQLLDQLQNHLQFLAKEYPSLSIIVDAVSNFASFYQRYEKSVQEAIVKGRTPIEKKMKDVLLMASWKDTNINALRESARRSHQKLFRLVRKFRAVLGQEMKTIIEQGLPDIEPAGMTEHNKSPSTVMLPSEAVADLEATLPGWLEEHKRVKNMPQTVNIMRRVETGIVKNSSVSQLMNEFVDGLHTSAAELRKETPSTLTEENKSLVKHLKTRKRKLFADTLRNLRQMGLQHNLAQDRLLEQDDSAKVFSAVAPVYASGDATLNAANYYFHKIIDLIPKIRDSARDHSEDLTPAEVGRSIGFAEGTLHLLLTQRKQLSKAEASLGELEKAVADIGAISNLQSSKDVLRLRGTDFDWRRGTAWLMPLLQYAVKLVQTHESLGRSCGNAQQLLQQSITDIERRRDELTASTSLPGSLTSETFAERELTLSQAMKAVGEALTAHGKDRPDIEYILAPLAHWADVTSSKTKLEGEPTTFKRLADSLSTLCDKVLVSTERAKQNCAKEPPRDTDHDWLLKSNNQLLAAVNGLRMPSVQKEIHTCVAFIHGALQEDPSVSKGITAAARLLAPILEQYMELCRSMTRQLRQNHKATSHMGFKLTTLFLQITSQGFCTPQEKSDESSGDSGKVESGTGLGDGEGAEDISKDIQDDEDLSELAQEANKEEGDEVEDEKDAVDMADEELEGEMGSVAGEEEEDDKKDGDEEEDGEDDMDEEAGDVDDLDPTAVDEKMWDGKDEEEAEKDQQGDKPKGQQKDDEQMATEDNQRKDDPEKQEPEPADAEDAQPEAEEVDEEKEEVQDSSEMNRQEQTAEENDALALPEEMDLDLDEEASETEDDDMNQLSDVEEDKLDDQKLEPDAEDEEGNGDEAQPNQEEDDQVSEKGEDEEEAAGKDDGQPTDEVKEEEEEEPEVDEQKENEQEQAPESADQGATDMENAAPSDVRGSGEDQNEESMDMDQEFQSNAAKQEEGKAGDGAADQAATAGKEGEMSRSNEPIERGEPEAEESQASTNDPFKKLGDALERWHRQQSDIQQANADQNAETKHEPDQAEEQSRQEFQHLQNDDDAADTQAMGTAKEDEVQPIDESMGIDDETQDPTSRLLDDATAEEQTQDDAEPGVQDDKMVDEDDVPVQKDADDGRSGVQTRQGNYQRDTTPTQEESQAIEQEEDETIEDASTQLSTTHISDDSRALRDYDEASQQWSEFQNKTHALSLSLTSQLRLILTPSQTTKLSGSFRTGKRLNIKRIIPYIASSYKRDKIWMRRSIPTKRTYQILLCVDDSKSMGESSSGKLAMESLVMVSRSLSMLEAGQIGVLGFGGDVFPAHSLTEPFASDAGAKVLQNFTFSQDKTDVALLIRQTIDTFKEARQQTSGTGSDLWQLALILSDGLTPSSAHDSIRRLLREAIEERIMIVFIIMDDTEKKKGDSVLELKEARFVREGGESRVVIERYLDTFPFQYYLIVHNLEDLPGALAGLLRTWFAEVSA